MANEQSQKRGGGYQIDEITYAKGRSTLNAYICPQGEMREGSKNRSQDLHVLNG